MMRGERSWAVAIRTPEGDIEIETHEAPTWAQKWSKIPLVRGVMALAESMALGMKALTWSANQPDPRRGADLLEGDGLDDRGRARRSSPPSSSCCPRSRPTASANILGVDGFWFHVAEGRAAPRHLPRVPAAHRSAEGHQARLPVPRCRAQGDRGLRERRRAHRRSRRSTFDTSHVRCGTNFLLTVMVDHHRRVLVRRPSRLGVADPLPDRAAAAHRRRELRGHPVRGEAHGMALGPGAHEARPAAAAAHDARAVARPGRGGGRVAARRCSPPSSSPRSRPGTPRHETEHGQAAGARHCVKFGIFYEHQLPRPWEEDSEYTLIQHALEQCELADQLGIDYVWEVEHHFLEEYSHSERARGVPRRRVAAHEAHPPRSRHRADAATVQPSRPGRRAGRDARPRVGRAGRLRHG